MIAESRFSLQEAAKALESHLPAIAVDLVNVASHLYAVDRSYSRGRQWKRSLGVSVAVSDMELWAAAQPFLQDALHHLTDDEWRIDFIEGRSTLPEENQPWLLQSRNLTLTSVGLFSGGLDSFAGAAAFLDEHPDESLGLVSVSSSTVVGSLQQKLFELLHSSFPNRVDHVRIPLKLIAAKDVERTQRTRGLVYSAMATAIAVSAHADRILIFETGYGAINPRLMEHQEGAQATKSTHPHVIQRLEAFYKQLIPDCPIELPHVNETKAELLKRIPAHLREGIRITGSCDAFPLRLKQFKQCGYCGSCILRQQAVRGASLEAFDRDDYWASPFRGGDRLQIARLMAAQAKSLAKSPEFTRAAAEWPELVLGLQGQLTLERTRWLNMLNRYGLEWRQMVAGDPSLANLLGWNGA